MRGFHRSHRCPTQRRMKGVFAARANGACESRPRLQAARWRRWGEARREEHAAAPAWGRGGEAEQRAQMGPPDPDHGALSESAAAALVAVEALHMIEHSEAASLYVRSRQSMKGREMQGQRSRRTALTHLRVGLAPRLPALPPIFLSSVRRCMARLLPCAGAGW
jgi:hypothetical protein